MLALPGAARAELQLSLYGGVQEADPSDVTVSGDSVVADDEFTATWEGRSLEAPFYWGARATWWARSGLGFGLDVNHAKTYADDETLAQTGYERLEFSDGLNIVTVNAYYRWDRALGPVTPYVGGGLGVSVPHVELTEASSETFEYQLTGPAATWIAGASVPITERVDLFGEYKGTWSSNEAELDTGGTLESDIMTNAVNFGVSFNF
ncbi:outer membrane beta-barrel protein [Pseudoroseicyclus sp. CLL3-39]|uniref:Outer membrane beta-barrel protein n=1 Tax=Pseudoroseicyclus tamaricis TaxID=2705421 RepID=A0A6B2K4F9_9RHOB|nr:outer membrane beta-barrel protein [Pseudoroseicyclus tamaricis]